MTEQHDTSNDPRWPEPPVAGDEASTLLGALERQRATFAWKAGGLDAAGLRATTAASAITLGGLLKHLARVEDDYSSVRVFGREARPPFDRTGWSDDWSTAADDAPSSSTSSGATGWYGARGIGERPPDPALSVTGRS
jgi:Protein of unknown function (DUF664)